MKNVSRKLLKHNSGFTLIELAGTIAMLSVALPALAFLFTITAQQDSNTNEGLAAHFLATSLINEMSQRRFRESVAHPAGGPSQGEVSGYDRRNFDDISDYSIFKSSWGPLTPPRDESGNILTNYSGFSQYVEIANIANPAMNTAPRNLASIADGTSDFKLVTVTIAWDKGKRKITLSKVFALNP